MPVPQLAARNLTKSFGGRKILHGLDLDVEATSRIGILGPNGGGKSTTLKILAGLEHADAGTVTYRKNLVTAYLPQIVDGDERDPLTTVKAGIFDLHDTYRTPLRVLKVALWIDASLLGIVLEDYPDQVVVKALAQGEIGAVQTVDVQAIPKTSRRR